MEDGHESLVTIAIALPIALLAAYIVGQLARWLLRGRVRLSTATTIVLSVIGISLGMLIAGLTRADIRVWNPLVFLLAVGMTTAILAVFAAVAGRMQRPEPREPVLD